MLAGLRRLALEPLLHFVLIGAVLFALDGLLAAAPAGPRTPAAGAATEVQPLPVPAGPIVVDDAAREQLVAAWGRTHTAPPTASELQMLVDRFIDEEVLYREGLRRGLARDDPEIRARVVSQMSYVLQSRVVVEAPTDAQLRAWFDAHRDRFAQPERVDFTQVFVQGTDEAALARARELLALLQGGAASDGLGDTFAGGRKFRGRRVSDLAERFGDAFVAGMLTDPVGDWTLRRSPDGVHLVRIDRRTAAVTPDFDAVREPVLHAFTDEERSTALEREKQELRAAWTIDRRP